MHWDREVCLLSGIDYTEVFNALISTGERSGLELQGVSVNRGSTVKYFRIKLCY